MRAPLVWLCLSCVGTVAAQEPALSIDLQPGAGAGLFLAHDSDGFTTRRATLEALPVLRDANHFAGLRLSRTSFEQDDWRRHGSRATVAGRSTDPATGAGWQGEIGVQEQGGHTLLALDGTYRYEPRPGTGLEVFASRDWVETRQALDQGVSFTFAGAAIDQAIGPHVTAAAVLGRQVFSDGNARSHGRARLIYQPSLDLGLTLQARWRAYRSSEDDVGGAYFNPSDYQEAMVALGWRQQWHRWRAALLAGIGREQVDAEPWQTTQLLSAELESPWRGSQFLKLGAGYMHNSANWGPGYDYRYLNVEWRMVF